MKVLLLEQLPVQQVVSNSSPQWNGCKSMACHWLDQCAAPILQATKVSQLLASARGYHLVLALHPVLVRHTVLALHKALVNHTREVALHSQVVELHSQEEELHRRLEVVRHRAGNVGHRQEVVHP